jgi:hypothetical protein
LLEVEIDVENLKELSDEERAAVSMEVTKRLRNGSYQVMEQFNRDKYFIGLCEYKFNGTLLTCLNRGVLYQRLQDLIRRDGDIEEVWIDYDNLYNEV